MTKAAKALAIETSGRIGSIALIDPTAQTAAPISPLIIEEQFEHGLQNAAKILPLIDRLLCARQMLANELEQVYISIGPGSFTGLRIGVTVAKTLSLATGLKIVAVPSVRVLVENAPPDAKHIVIVLDAKRDQIFTARFERVGENWIERQPAQVNSLTAMLENSPRPVHLLGEGIPYHEKFIPADPQIIRTAPETWRSRALGHVVAGNSAWKWRSRRRIHRCRSS